MIKIKEEMQREMNKIQQEINNINNWLNEEDTKTINSINEIIISLKEIRERKAEKEIIKSPKRKEII